MCTCEIAGVALVMHCWHRSRRPDPRWTPRTLATCRWLCVVLRQSSYVLVPAMFFGLNRPRSFPKCHNSLLIRGRTTSYVSRTTASCLPGSSRTLPLPKCRITVGGPGGLCGPRDFGQPSGSFRVYAVCGSDCQSEQLARCNEHDRRKPFVDCWKVDCR